MLSFLIWTTRFSNIQCKLLWFFYITPVLFILNSCSTHALLSLINSNGKVIEVVTVMSVWDHQDENSKTTESFRNRILCLCFLAWSIYITGPKDDLLAATVHCKLMPNILSSDIPRSPWIQKLSKLLRPKYFWLLYIICIDQQFLYCGTKYCCSLHIYSKM